MGWTDHAIGYYAEIKTTGNKFGAEKEMFMYPCYHRNFKVFFKLEISTSEGQNGFFLLRLKQDLNNNLIKFNNNVVCKMPKLKKKTYSNVFTLRSKKTNAFNGLFFL